MKRIVIGIDISKEKIDASAIDMQCIGKKTVAYSTDVDKRPHSWYKEFVHQRGTNF